MEIGEIWISIILPILIGPIFIFFKTIWDRTCNLKQQKKQLLFDDTRNRLKHQLDDFYYPVYLKLLLLYSLSFVLPETEKANSDDVRDSVSSSDSEFCSSDEEQVLTAINDESRRRKSVQYKKRRCMAYYKINNEYVKCRNVIPHSGFSKICKCCRWKFLSGKIEISLLDENDINPDSVFHVPSHEDLTVTEQEKNRSTIPTHSLMSKTDTLKKRTKRSNRKNSIQLNEIKDITIQIPDFIDVTDLEDYENKKSIIDQMNMQSISITEKTIPFIECACNKYYSEIADCIEKTIHIIEPNTRLTKHLILFLKYAKIRDLIHENKLCVNDCKPEDFGAKNNINILLGHIEANLNKYGNQYKTLMEKGTI